MGAKRWLIEKMRNEIMIIGSVNSFPSHGNSRFSSDSCPYDCLFSGYDQTLGGILELINHTGGSFDFLNCRIEFLKQGIGFGEIRF